MQILENAEAHVTSDGWAYDLLIGGYLKPEAFLGGEDLDKVKSAVEVIKEFIEELDANELIDRI